VGAAGILKDVRELPSAKRASGVTAQSRSASFELERGTGHSARERVRGQIRLGTSSNCENNPQEGGLIFAAFRAR